MGVTSSTPTGWLRSACWPAERKNLARKEDYEESANIADACPIRAIPDLERVFSFQYFIMVTL